MIHITLGHVAYLLTQRKYTMFYFQKAVLKSIEKDHPSFTGDGYTSLCIIYGVFAVCNWLAPTIIALIGSRKSIYLGSICYV